MNWRSLKTQLTDGSIALVLALAYCVWLLSTVDNLGYARDEGFYFQAADSYLRWFKQLFDDPSAALTQHAVDRAWTVNHEHPALIKSLFSFSRWILYNKLGLFDERGTSYRFVGIAMSSVAVAITYAWGRRALASHGTATSRIAAIVAAASFALMPRVFYHSHLDCFDMPMLAMWMLTSYAYWRSLEPGRWGWAIGAGILYGLALDTKHNSWLLPFALVGHLVIWRGPTLLAALRRKRFVAAFRQIPLALWLMAVIGPLLFYALWPWIWFDTFDRLREYVIFHTRHVFYNMEFLGKTYFEPPFPRSYAPVMTIATVPAITLTLAAAGGLLFVRRAVDTLQQLWSVFRSSGLLDALIAPSKRVPADGDAYATQWLWLLSIAVSYAPWLSSNSPIFGGTKHWMTAYPFMALFAAVGFVWICDHARAAITARFWRKTPLIEASIGLCVLVAPLAITAHSHPWGLSAYTPAVGGAPGAASLGLNRGYWGYQTGAITDHINESTSARARIFIHDTAMASWHMMAKDGRVKKTLQPRIGVAGSEFAIYHHEQHMSRVEHQIWVQYGTTTPKLVAGIDGVPVIWTYADPKKPVRSSERKGPSSSRSSRGGAATRKPKTKRSPKE
jgi:4-amino-4-deoxy-L-arabinose transferase-like glycosyltransferase